MNGGHFVYGPYENPPNNNRNITIENLVLRSLINELNINETTRGKHIICNNFDRYIEKCCSGSRPVGGKNGFCGKKSY